MIGVMDPPPPHVYLHGHLWVFVDSTGRTHAEIHSFFAGSKRWSEQQDRTAGHLGGWDSYPKQTGQIRSEWRERSWKPSRADPVLRLSHIPPYPSLSSPSPFSPFHHRPASSFPHLACHKSHFSLFFKQYRHVWGGVPL